MSCVSKDIQKQCRIQTQNDSIQPYGCPKMIVLHLQHHPRHPAEIDVPQFFLDQTPKHALSHVVMPIMMSQIW